MSGADDEQDTKDTFAALAQGVRPAELGAVQRDSLRQRVLERARATAPDGTQTVRADEHDWIAIDPLVSIKILKRDAAAGTQTLLMRVAPGGRIPAHRHALEEEFIILEGECFIGTHRLASGDVHVAEAGSWHDDITTPTGALVMVRGEIRGAG